MSVYSDDTDVLLLIPPDFFSVPSDSEEDNTTSTKPTERLLVSDLISQVNDLEGRICMIENQTIINMPTHGNLQYLRHFGSADALNTSCKSSYNSRSLQTTPLKTHTLPSPCKGWRTGVNRSPLKYNRIEHQNMLTSHQYVNQRDKDDQLLKEINNFFKQKNSQNNEGNDPNEKDEEKENSMPELTETDSIHLSTAVFNLNKVNDLLKQLEETQAEIEQKLRLKGLSGLESEDHLFLDPPDKKLQHFPKDSDISENTTDYKSPRRFLNFDSLSPQKTAGDAREGKKDALTETDALELGFDCLSPNKDEVVSTEPKTSAQELGNLLSLRSLWGSSKKTEDTKTEDQKVLKQKYQEEKCRRQHCEELIQKLQLRLLEEQQKIAVAMKVDKEKDEAISRLTEGWNRLVGQWKELESQKNALGKKLQSDREKFQNEVSVACQTVKRYETELSKALDLAHGYKEKCEMSEKEKKNLTMNATKEIERLKEELREVGERLQKEQSQGERLEKLSAAREENLIQMKSKIFDMQNQIRELRKGLKDQQTELEIVKHDKERLTEKMKEEKNRVAALEQNKKSLVQSNEELKKKEKGLRENIKGMAEQMEKIKVDLKEFYQEQVEKIVQEKLKEFQEQLTAAEKALGREIEERERKVTEMAVKQVQQIVEKHVVEVNLLEEKHREEIELWKVKVLQAEEKVEELQKRVELYSNHKTEIAQKLQSVMETQWQEALKIITSSSPQHQKSPLASGRTNQDKGLSRQNTFTMLSCGWGDGEPNKNGISPADAESPSDSPPTETPFCKDGQLTYREQSRNNTKLNYRIDETPQKMEAGEGDPLQRYIRMLLERPPGVPIDDSLDKSFDSTLFASLGDGVSLRQWQHILSERSSHTNSDLMKQEILKENKVGWK